MGEVRLIGVGGKTSIPPKLLEHVAEELYTHDCHSQPPCSWEDASTVGKDYYRGIARVALTAILAGVDVEEDLRIEADDADGLPITLRHLPGDALERGRGMVQNYSTGFSNVRLCRRTVIKLPWALVLDEPEMESPDVDSAPSEPDEAPAPDAAPA